jgi:hypothetical protein
MTWMMFWTLIVGMILALFFYLPLIFYLIWSWRWLQRHFDDQVGGTWLRPLAVLLVVSSIWFITVNIVLPIGILWALALDGAEASFANAVYMIAYLPITVVLGIIGLLRGEPLYYEGSWQYWFWGFVGVAILLLAGSVIEWLIIRRIQLRKKT